MKTMKKVIAMSLLTSVCGVSVTALAQPKQAAGEPADGHRGKAHVVERADPHGSGELTPEERRAKHDAWAEKRFAKLDKNGDGALSSHELPERFGRFMLKADANEDGILTKAELKTAHDARMEKVKARKAERSKRKHAFKARVSTARTKTDFKTPTSKRFKRADHHSDGAITQDEMKRRGRRHRV